MDETGKVTIVRFLHDVRVKMQAERPLPDDKEYRSATDSLGYTLHTVFCPIEDHTSNVLFSVEMTADGEPFVDWKLNTHAQWKELMMRADLRLVALGLLEKLSDD